MLHGQDQLGPVHLARGRVLHQRPHHAPLLDPLQDLRPEPANRGRVDLTGRVRRRGRQRAGAGLRGPRGRLSRRGVRCRLRGAGRRRGGGAGPDRCHGRGLCRCWRCGRGGVWLRRRAGGFGCRGYRGCGRLGRWADRAVRGRRCRAGGADRRCLDRRRDRSRDAAGAEAAGAVRRGCGGGRGRAGEPDRLAGDVVPALHPLQPLEQRALAVVGAGQQHPGADQLQQQPRRGGAAHLDQAVVHDVGHPGQRAPPSRSAWPVIRSSWSAGASIRPLATASGTCSRIDQVAQAFQQVGGEPAGIVAGLDHPVDGGEDAGAVGRGERVAHLVEQRRVGDAEQRHGAWRR